MPHKVDVRCPSCSGKSTFEFAEVVKLKLKSDVTYFQNSKLFDYELFTDSCGHKWHGAIYYAGLHGGSVKAINELPEGYKAEDWEHSRYLYRNHGLDIGSITCPNCHLNQNHILSWPSDAYFSIEYKGQQLWAFDRESVNELKEYITDKHRNVDKYKWRNFLLHIPTVFKKQGAREYVVKHINRLLSC